MKVPEIKEQLDLLGVAYPSDAKKAELEELLLQHQDENSEEKQEDEQPELKLHEDAELLAEDVDLYEGRRVLPKHTLILSSRIVKQQRLEMVELRLADGTSMKLLESELQELLVK